MIGRASPHVVIPAKAGTHLSVSRLLRASHWRFCTPEVRDEAPRWVPACAGMDVRISPDFIETTPGGACAQAHRHRVHPDHRRGADRDRAGVRVRLFRGAGLQGAEGRGLSDRPGQFEPGDDHDRPGARRRHLYRADHPGDGRADHRPRAAKGLPDALLPTMGGQTALNVALALDRSGVLAALRRRDDRRQRSGDRQGRGPAAVPPGDGPDRARFAREPAGAHAGRGAAGARRCRPAGDHPAVLHPGRHRRRHRLQPRGVRGDRRAAACAPRPPTRC